MKNSALRILPEPAPLRPPQGASAPARRLWRELREQFGIDDPGGLGILEVVIRAYDRAARCRAAVERDGLSTRDRFGQIRAHPLLAAERDARAQVLAALKALNLDLEPLRDRPRMRR